MLTFALFIPTVFLFSNFFLPWEQTFWAHAVILPSPFPSPSGRTWKNWSGFLPAAAVLDWYPGNPTPPPGAGRDWGFRFLSPPAGGAESVRWWEMGFLACLCRCPQEEDDEEKEGEQLKINHQVASGDGWRAWLPFLCFRFVYWCFCSGPALFLICKALLLL